MLYKRSKMSKKIEHNKTLIEMQLRGIQKEKEPNEYQNEDILKLK